ncbi:MAG: hypothetical protein KDA32_06625, partial [Phycisphaerales bacterium]|nr:hypothetical protein [Phycisphaerales bacterium]
ERIPQPASTVHFLIMAYEGEFAGADHPHAEEWIDAPLPPSVAGQQVQINAVSGLIDRWEARSNWGYLDGHAETVSFSNLMENVYRNRFDPRVAY